MSVDLLDILTPDEALRALSLDADHTAWSEEIEQMVTGISRDIDRLCGPVVQRTVTDRLTVEYGRSRVLLRYFPVTSVTSITEYTPGSASGQLLTAEDEDTFATYGYLLDPDAGIVTRRSSGSTSTWTAGTRNVVAVYVAGRYATTATVDRRFKRVAAAVLRAEWRVAAPARQRSQDFTEGEFAGFTTTDDMIRQLLPGDLLEPRVGAA